MGGLLIPPWYQADLDTPSPSSFWLVAFLFGFSSACGVFCLATIVHQAYRTWQRSKRLITHPYIILITLEWTSSIIISIISYLFLNSVIPPSFWLFFGILLLWVIQHPSSRNIKYQSVKILKNRSIQCLMHIIINRIALIMYDARRVRRLKWTVTLLIGIINIAVFIIWMPARLQISPTWIAINNVWDRVEKGLLALIDLGLNLKFIHLVHTELIKHGLTKYRDLYRFNITMIFVSISLDIVLIGIMSLPHQSSFVYVQFHPLMYLIKLKVEMNMADLIVKIVRATSPPPDHELHRYAASSSPQIARPAQSRNNTDTSKGTTTSGTYTCGDTLQSPTTIVEHSPDPGRRTSRSSQHASPPWELKQMPSHFDVHDVVHPQLPEHELQQLEQHPQGQQYNHHNQQQQRKISIAEGSVSAAGGSNNGIPMVPLPIRPSLGGRNFSELTQLELGAGYVTKEKRDTLCREQAAQQL